MVSCVITNSKMGEYFWNAMCHLPIELGIYWCLGNGWIFRISSVSVIRKTYILWCSLCCPQKINGFEEFEKGILVFLFSSNLIGRKCPVCTNGPPLYYSANLVPSGTRFFLRLGVTMVKMKWSYICMKKVVKNIFFC